MSFGNLAAVTWLTSMVLFPAPPLITNFVTTLADVVETTPLTTTLPATFVPTVIASEPLLLIVKTLS